MELDQANQAIWTDFHGGKLSEFFNRSVAKYYNPKAVMRRNVLVFDSMMSLESVGRLSDPKAVSSVKHELHSIFGVFRQSAYDFAGSSEFALVFSLEHIRDHVSCISGKKVSLSPEYKSELAEKVMYIRNFARSSQIRRIFG